MQGEGRGHLTQAVAVAAWLRARGHEVVRVLVGQSARRAVPRFAQDELGAPVELFPSPNFVADRMGAVRLGATIARNARAADTFAPALRLFDHYVAADRADVVVNFYEGLAGLWAATRRARPPVVAVAHQFMFLHPAYGHVRGRPLHRAAVLAHTRLAGAGAAVRLALSLYGAPSVPGRRLRVVPPVLRPAALALRPAPADDGSLLVYLVEPALADGLRAWARRHPEVAIHCFWDGPPSVYGTSLRFHALDGAHFLRRMALCRGVVCTAGFESVSEAMLLGKPVLMVPVPKHYEQACNALDAAAVGAGLSARSLEEGLDRFLTYLPTYRPPEGFRPWVESAEAMVLDAIERAAGAGPPRYVYYRLGGRLYRFEGAPAAHGDGGPRWTELWCGDVWEATPDGGAVAADGVPVSAEEATREVAADAPSPRSRRG